MSEQVAIWRCKNNGRYLLQARADNTRARIRKELEGDANFHELNHLFKLLHKHEDVLAQWKAENPTDFQSSRKKRG